MTGSVAAAVRYPQLVFNSLRRDAWKGPTQPHRLARASLLLVSTSQKRVFASRVCTTVAHPVKLPTDTLDRFSNGCDISVDECDGNTGQVIKAKWHYVGPAGQNNGWTSEGIELMPPPASEYMSPAASSIAGRKGKKPLRNATLCDPNLRTVNTHAECECPHRLCAAQKCGGTPLTKPLLLAGGSQEDVYYYSPWRAPGAAPVIDSWCACHPRRTNTPN